jgi:hypothetical protein
LQGRDQTLGHLHNEPAIGPLKRCADQEAVAADGIHRIGHSVGYGGGRGDEIDLCPRRTEPLHGELAQLLPLPHCANLSTEPCSPLAVRRGSDSSRWYLEKSMSVTLAVLASGICHVSRRLQRVAQPESSDFAVCMMPIAMQAFWRK